MSLVPVDHVVVEEGRVVGYVIGDARYDLECNLVRPKPVKSASTLQLLTVSKMGFPLFKQATIPIHRGSLGVFHAVDTPLFLALKKGNVKLALSLLEGDLDSLLAVDCNTGMLHHAVLCKSSQVVTKIFEVYGDRLDVNLGAGSSCGTPLHWLCSFTDDVHDTESLKVMETMVNHHGVTIDAVDESGFSPLHYAINQNNAAFTRVLLARGADPNLYSENGTTPLLMGVEQQNLEVTQILLDCETIEVNRADARGQTALMRSVVLANMDLVMMMIQDGAIISLEDDRGQTAMTLTKNDDTRKFLEECHFYQTHRKKWKVETFQTQMRGRSSSPATHEKIRASSKNVGKAVYDSVNHLLDLDYFEHSLLGTAQLGMCMCPGRNKPKAKYVWRRDLKTDLDVVERSGCDVVVSLVRRTELLKMGILDLLVRIKERGMVSHHFPITDKWIPSSMQIIVTLVEMLLAWAKQGKKVVIHCNGGKGRTGMVVVAVMVALGMSVEEGIEAVRKRRKGMIKNPAQILYLRYFETQWKKSHGDYESWTSESSSSSSSTSSSEEAQDDPQTTP